MDNFYQPTPQATGPLMQTGDQSYVNQATQLQANALKPQYNQALQQIRQNYGASGQLEGGLEKQAELGNMQDYNNTIANAARQNSLRGADVSLENQRIQQQRNWQVEDMNTQWQHLQDQMNFQAQMQNNQSMAGLFGQLGGGVGALAGEAVNYNFNPMMQYYRGLSGASNPGQGGGGISVPQIPNLPNGSGIGYTSGNQGLYQ